MKTTEKGKLSIEIGKKNIPTVVFYPVDTTVWMDRNDLCELFGVYMPTIEACLDSIFRTNMFHIPQVCQYQLVCEKNKVVYDVTAVNLDVIIAMVFRIESFNANILRNWLFERFRESECVPLPLLSVTQNYSLN